MSLRARLFAGNYERLNAGAERAGLATVRLALLNGARGRVLEIGGGTGANLPYYGRAVESLTVSEPDPAMLRRLERKVSQQATAARLVRAPAEHLPFDDATFDTVVSTLVLCEVNDQQRALRELRRVLRPTGELLFLEHVRADDPRMARLQDRLNPVHRFVVGCNCNRRTLDSIRDAGFVVTKVQHIRLPKVPQYISPAIAGIATAGHATPPAR